MKQKGLQQLSIEEIQRGYVLQATQAACIYCAQQYQKGQIFPIESKWFDFEAAMQQHIVTAHGGAFQALLQEDNKALGLTENQRRLLLLLHAGQCDKTIAQQLGVTQSTVRHQRFSLREKAKQAKLFLCAYALAEAGSDEQDAFIEIHESATMVDDRYLITNKEEEEIQKQVFLSFTPLQLKHFPVKEKKKLVILRRIAQEFTPGQQYTEREVNTILESIYFDYVTLRRYLIEYGFLDRTRDGKTYWKLEVGY